MMSAQERRELAKEIAEEMAKNHATCRLGITREQADALIGLSNAGIAAKKIAGVTAVTVIIGAFLSFFAWAVVEKIKSLR